MVGSTGDACQHGMDFAVLNYIYLSLITFIFGFLLLMLIFRSSGVTDTNLVLQSKMRYKYLRKQCADKQ